MMIRKSPFEIVLTIENILNTFEGVRQYVPTVMVLANLKKEDRVLFQAKRKSILDYFNAHHKFTFVEGKGFNLG